MARSHPCLKRQGFPARILKKEGSIPSFVLENVSEHMVRKDFILEIFSDLGGLGEKKIFEEEVETSKINNSEKKLEKSVSLGLEAGVHHLTVIANRDKRLFERDYENNKGEITIDVPMPQPEPEPTSLAFDSIQDIAHLNSVPKQVSTQEGELPLECLFLIDNSASMNIMLQIVNSVAVQTGEMTKRKKQKFTYAISTINSSGWDERWGDMLYAIGEGFNWNADSHKKVVFVIGDGGNNGDHHYARKEAKKLHEKGIVLHGIDLETPEFGSVIQEITSNGGGIITELSKTFDIDELAEEFAGVLTN